MLDLRNGLTNCAGISRTSWPCSRNAAPSQFVGNRDDHVDTRRSQTEFTCPLAEPSGVVLDDQQNSPRAVDEQAPQIDIASFADAKLAALCRRSSAPRDETEPGGN